MITNIIYFIVGIFMSYLLVFEVISLFTGRMYTYSSGSILKPMSLLFRPSTGNVYLWGDKSVRPGSMRGSRARLLSLSKIILLTFVIFLALASKDISLNLNRLIFDNSYITNVTCVIIGIILGIWDFNNRKKIFIDPEDEINIYTK